MTSRSVGRSHGIDGDYLGQVYKDHLSGYEHWDQKAHAKEWILTAKNMGRHLSIDESMYCGRLYTFVSNKDAHGGRGTIIAIIAGVKAATVLRWLLEIPEEERRGVLDVSMDFSDSMKLIAQTAFPNARISLDRFHVFQDLNRYFMKAFSGVRDKVLVAIKHEKAAGNEENFIFFCAMIHARRMDGGLSLVWFFSVSLTSSPFFSSFRPYTRR